MLIPSQVVAILKYGFLSLVVTGAGFLIANVALLKYEQNDESIDDLVYKPQFFLPTASGSSMLDKDFLDCLTHPKKTFCIVSAGRRLGRLKRLAANQSSEALTKSLRRRALSRTLADFCSLVQPLNMKPILMEPSMLFCILSPFSKYHLITNGYRPGAFFGSKRVVTVAVQQEDLRTLQEETFLQNSSANGFEMTKLQTADLVTSHVFFKRRNFTIHLVGLFGREQISYVWTRGWKSDTKDLLFTEDNTFENFTYTSLQQVYPEETTPLYLPSDPLTFLLDTAISKFESCSPPKPDLSIFEHPRLTVDQMKIRTEVVFREMRRIWRPVYEPIWLWAESFAGWLESCDIFQRTFELSVAVQPSSLQSLKKASFEDNEYLIVEDEHFYDDKKCKMVLNCHGLRVNIYAAFEDDTSASYYDIDENNSTSRIVLPKFNLCSTDVYGQRVHVPCNTEAFVVPISKNNTR